MTRDDRDDVATLVRLAGPRALAPPERLARAKAAALTTWRHEVRGRSRRRYGVLAALATAATLALAVALRLFPGGSAPPQAIITVESLHGSAWTGGQPLVLGGQVAVGSELATAETGSLALRLATGHSLRLDHSTTVRLLDARSIALEAGAIYVDSAGARAATGPLRVRTQLGTIRELGTQFEVRLADGTVRVRLREGAVVVEHGSRSDAVAVGTELALGVDGSTSVRSISVHGPEWAWVAQIAPMLDLEGRTARAFLEWVARERGLSLVFADAAVARAAGEVVLSGSIEGMTLDQALDTVLPSCRMVHSVADGALVVAALRGTS